MASRNRRAIGLAVAVVGAVGPFGAIPGTASAVTLSGKPFRVATANPVGNVAVTVDPTSGTGYFAWSNAFSAGGNTVGFCAVPKGGTVCTESLTLTPAAAQQYVDNVQILDDSGTLVIIADVYGAPGDGNLDYLPEQEWVSTDAGATWVQAGGGLSVADGILDADTEPVSAVALPGTGELGYGWETASGPPTFDAFPLNAPPECSVLACDGTAIPDGGPYPFATLQPASNPDVIGNPDGSRYAAQSGSAPGVLGVFSTIDTSGPLGCSKAFGTAFVYGSGDQSASNNYSLSPGLAGSAWKVAATQLDCDVEYPAVGGGPSGFGVLETDEADNRTIYHPFDASTASFSAKPVTVNKRAGEQQPSLGQDGAGGVYATYLLGGAGGPLELSYSGDAGAIWESNAINHDSDQEISEMTSAVGSEGQGWAIWWDTSTNTINAQQFDAEDASPPLEPTKLKTVQTSGPVHGANLSIKDGTVAESDRATLSGANAYIATGKVKYALYSDSACTKLASTAGSAKVVYGKPGASRVIATALAPGTYYWQASYSGDVANGASTSKCGSEILTVRPKK